MKTHFYLLFALLVTLASCNKRVEVFAGTWESESYNAYVDINRKGDAYVVSIRNKSGERDWLIEKDYTMHYDNGMLHSDKGAFKTISFDKANNTIRINGERDEWTKTSEMASL